MKIPVDAKFNLKWLLPVLFIAGLLGQRGVLRVYSPERTPVDAFQGSLSSIVVQEPKQDYSWFSPREIAISNHSISNQVSVPRIASLYYVRETNGKWTPSPNSFKNLTLISNRLFNVPSKSTSPTNFFEYLGIVRITKTGSTSLLNFFKTSSKVQTLDRHLDFASLPPGSGAYISAFCVFGNHPGHGQDEVDKINKRKRECNHIAYRTLTSTLAKTLHFSYSMNTLGGNQTEGQALQVKFDVATIVRDPMERYLSFFHYWRRIFPAWRNAVTPQQAKASIAGDFELFLQLISETPIRRANSRYQYEFFSSDPHEAVSFVNHHRILPLVNECFDASMWLLTDMYPQLFVLNDTRLFVHSGKSQANAAYNVKKSFKSKDGTFMHRVKEMNLPELQRKSREWLVGEYAFYEANVKLFVELLRASHVDATVVEECLTTLESRQYDF